MTDRILASLQTLPGSSLTGIGCGRAEIRRNSPSTQNHQISDGREWIIKVSANLTEHQHRGVAPVHWPSAWWLPAYKMVNYLASLLARTTAQNMLAAEAILMDESGNWLETSTGKPLGWRMAAVDTSPAANLTRVVRSGDLA